MLTIRAAQLAAFSRARLARLEQELLAHVLDSFPAARRMDRVELESTIHAMTRAARQMGAVSERAAYRYVNLAMQFGPGFADDPALSWMRPYLEDDAVPDPEERLARLHAAAAARLERGDVP